MESCDIFQLWRLGALLDDAWFEFGDEHQKSQYRSSGIRPEFSAYLISDMRENLLHAICNEQLRAIGLRTAPNPSPAPEFISSTLFFKPEINWEKSELIVGVWQFINIKICRPKNQDRVLVQKDLVGQVDDAASNGINSAAENADLPTPKMGRPPLIPLLRHLIAEIGHAELGSLPPMQQIARIQKQYEAKFGKRPPAPNTVRKALKAEGLA